MKTVYSIFAAALISLALSGCGAKAADFSQNGDLTAVLKHIWEPQDFYPAYAMSSVSYDDNAIIFARRGDVNGSLGFMALEDGSEIRSMPLTVGNGPGELQGFQAIDVQDGVVTIFDNAQGKLCVFKSDGEHVDDYALNSDIGLPMTSTVVGDYLYMNGKIKHKLLKYSLSGNEIVKKIDYEKYSDTPENGDRFQAGLLQYDSYTNTLFLGYYAKPFRMEQYDMDLNKLNTFTSDRFDSSSECAWCITRSNTITQDGDRVIGGIAFDENYIYVTYGGGYEYTGDESGQGRMFEYSEAPVIVTVFDRKTNKEAASLGIDKIPYIRGFIRILQADKEKLVFEFSDAGGMVDKAMGRPRPEANYRTFAIAVTDNPLYK